MLSVLKKEAIGVALPDLDEYELKVKSLNKHYLLKFVR